MSETDTSSVSLYAAAKIIAPECQSVNATFVVCKKDKPNPAHCVQEGEKVTACVLSTLRLLEEKCTAQFAASRVCLKDNQIHFEKCREQEMDLKRCWKRITAPPAPAAASNE